MSTTTGAPTFDLQSHSICSDGTLAPAAVVAAAAAAGVTLLALTDHDTVDGVDEALAAAREHAIGVVPAVELSTVDEGGEDFHVLGYGIDHADAALAEALAHWREDRAARVERMAARLCELGLAPDREALDERLAAGRPVGRPHLAAAAIAANRARLQPVGLDDPSAFLEAYLIAGCPAYCRRQSPTCPRRSPRSTRPAAWRSGRIPSSTCGRRARCARRSGASNGRASTASRRSTRPMTASRRCC